MGSVGPPVPRQAADAEPLFKEATATFLECLSEEERLNFLSCSSPEALVANIAALYPKSRKSLADKTAQHVSSFSLKLKPYFEILGIFVQSHPEWTALAWGAIRLILEVSCCCAGSNVLLTNCRVAVTARQQLRLVHRKVRRTPA